MSLLEIVEETYEIRNSIKVNDLFDDIQNNIPVLFWGTINADIMVIARDLGKNEVLEEKPLIGKSGSIFRKLVNYLEFDKNLYITNLVPYKPTNNSAFPKYIRKKFQPILKNQIKLIRPKVILTMGTESTKDILDNNISGLKNYIMDYIESEKYRKLRNPLNLDFKCLILPMVHPSYLIRKGINSSNVIEKRNKVDDLFLYFYTPMKLAKKLIKKEKEK